jgi:trigger factor
MARKKKADQAETESNAAEQTAVAEHNHDHAGHDHNHPEGDEGATKLEQTVTVEDSGPARKALTIEIPESRIKEKIESSFVRLRDDAVLPGFRRGRAPQRLLEKRFGTSVRDDVKGQLLSESYTAAIEEHKLDVIGEPDIKDADKITLPESGPLKFRVEVEVSPTVELPSLEGIEVNKTKRDVTDEQITGEIERLRERYGRAAEVSGEAAENDYIKADVRILAGENAGDDAEVLQHLPETYVQVSGESREFKGHVAGIVVQALGKQLAGKKVGETVRISQSGPQGHENEKIKGQPITILIRIDKIERLEPAPLDQLLPQLGMENEQALRDRVRQMLEDRRNKQQQGELHQQVADYLLEKVDLTLPEGITGRQSARVLRRRALEMAYQGVGEQEIEQKIAEMRSTSEEDARRQLKLFFILDTAAKQLDVDVSEQEINGRIAMMAMQQGRRPEKLRQQMQRSGEVEHLYLQIREQKVLDKIIEKAKINEVDAPAEGAESAAGEGEKKPKKGGKKKKAAGGEGGEEKSE